MPDLTNIPAIAAINDASNIRILLYQSGRLVHAPLQQIIDAIGDTGDLAIGGPSLLLEVPFGFSYLLLEGDHSGTLYLEGDAI